MARRKRFSAEFKRQALRRANEPGMTDTLVCEEIGSGGFGLLRLFP
jgi:transposase-like protein